MLFKTKCFSCKVLVVGGGTGGCSMAAKFAKKFKDPNQVIIVEPNDVILFSTIKLKNIIL